MENNTEEKGYTLRSLMADDIFPMMNIISKIGIKKFKACFDTEEVRKAISSLAAKNKGVEVAPEDEVDVERIGMLIMIDVADILISNLSQCKDDIYVLLAQMSGKTCDEIAKLPLRTFIGMIKDVLQKDNFADFFGDVLSLVPKGK